MKKVCVIGYPIAHSRSPLIHNYWLQMYGIPGLYEKREVKVPELQHFLHHLTAQGYVGCNVTIPHKEAALAFVPHLEDVVKRTGSLNTVYFVGETLCATSTDGEGFYQNLVTQVPELDLTGKTVVIFGAGGSARAITERLLRENIGKIKILNRTHSRAEELAALFGSKVVPIVQNSFVSESRDAVLVINTTAQGLRDQEKLNVDLSCLPPQAVVADIVYVPLKTSLLIQAEARGLRTVGGLGMLLHQAVVGFEKWYGLKPVVTHELYQRVAKDVEQGSN